jgi:hypothetical protein
MKEKFVLIMLMITFLQGCSPDKFTLNFRSENILFGNILSNIETFEQVNDNSFLLKGGTVAIRRVLMTQSSISFNYKVIKGDSLIFFIRNVVDNFQPENGIAISLTQDGCFIKDDGLVKTQSYEIKLSNKDEKYINIRTVGNLTHFRHECDDISVSSLKPATEYLIIQAPPNTEVLISGLEFEKVLKIPSEESIDF